MIHLIGNDEIFKNIIALGYQPGKPLPKNSAEVEENLHSFLSSYQPQVPRSKRLGTQIIDDPMIENELAELYRTDALLDDRNQASLIGESLDQDVRNRRENFLKQALNEFKTKIPMAYEAFDACIDSLFLRNSSQSGGGSTSNAVGVIWINSRDHWQLQDLVELLLHELVHNLVFLDELRYLHFVDYSKLVLEENFAESAILHIPRPVDKVFHSIAVATEVLIARELYLGEPEKTFVHPPSDKMLKQTLDSLQSLKDLRNYSELLTSRGQFIMDLCASKLEGLRQRERKSA